LTNNWLHHKKGRCCNPPGSPAAAFFIFKQYVLQEVIMKPLRILWCALLLLFAFLPAAFAAQPEITADSSYLDINTGRYVLVGHVKIVTPDRTFSADRAQVSIDSMEVWGEGSISVQQKDITFTGDKVYARDKDKTARITGHADFRRTGLIIQADEASYQWETKAADFRGNVTLLHNGRETKADHLRYDLENNKILETT